MSSDIHVVFATPTLDFHVAIEHRNSTVVTDRLLRENGIRCSYICLAADPYLAKVRSKLATVFLEDYPDATDLFFIDDDIGFPSEAVLRFLRYEEEIVAGIYSKKCDRLEFPCDLIADESGHLMRRGELVRAATVPTGFLRIKRKVIERMATLVEKFCDYGRNEAGDLVPRDYYAIFEMGVNNNRYWGEDVLFCNHLKGLGIDIWVDPNVPMTHRGTKIWAANLVDHLSVFEGRALSVAKVQAEKIA